MMTQAELVERAKQGNPQAIASLMNLVLSPKGVTAKAAIKEDCLHICFSSEQGLSQKTIVSFVRNGLAALGKQSFQRVKVYAQKNGQAAPIWTETFTLGEPTARPLEPQVRSTGAAIAAPAFTVQAPPVPLAFPTPAVQPERTAYRTQAEEVAPLLTDRSGNPGTTTQSVVDESSGGEPSLPTFTPVSAMGGPPELPTTPRGSNRPPARRGQPLPLLKQVTRQTQHLWRSVSSRFTAGGGASNKYVLASAVGAGAFLFGGIVAVMTNSQASGTSQASTGEAPAPVAASTNQSLVQPGGEPAAGDPQNEAKSYLLQMNKAQQAFYQTNSRFATSLEELERSASIISQSSNYSYKLILRDQAQSILTAIPKTDNLKSYSGTVQMNPAVSSSIETIICETSQPSKFPPVLPQASGATPIQCPSDAQQVIN